MDRRKELKEAYKKTIPDMGVYIIKSSDGRKCLLEATRNIKSGINRSKFTLDFGSHPNQELQTEWKIKGQSEFQMDVLEILEYGRDESQTDYTEELELLKSMWERRLKNEGMEFFGE
ncbi:GIY-YIG nuclease family protein [Gudongella sp. DL1XJH-153]|uniref:GIY-YIG nuclease family protein n=1 Tax=Gudongella sp. DL1XJH-153 TaxID=3409804 RepID=UPI003BB4C4C9